MMTKARIGLVMSMVASLGVGAATVEVAPPYQPLAFLAGHCWEGAFPGGKQTDEHCFSWIYDGKFLRDTHVLRGESVEGRGGETTYYWNGAAEKLEYIYVESNGAFVRGTVATDGAALVFPPADYVENGKTMRIRSRWAQASADRYDVVTEFEGKDGWKPGFQLQMQRVN